MHTNARRVRSFFFHRSGRWRVQRNHHKRKKNWKFRWRHVCLERWARESAWRSCRKDGNEKALEGVAGNCSEGDHRIQQKDKACMHRRSSWIHEKAFGIHSTKKSWRSHRGERVLFNKSQQFGAKLYSEAPSDENSGCEGSSGQGMEEARNEKSLAIGQDEEQKGRHSEAQREKKKVHFAALMGICHWENAELEPKYQKFYGGLVLRADIVKDNSGAYAAVTERGSSASQVTAATLQGYQIVHDKQPTWYQLTPKSKWETLPDCSKCLCQNVLIFGYVHHDTSGQNLCPTLKNQWFHLNEICMVTPPARLLRERQFQNVLLGPRWKNVPNWECLLAHRRQGIFLSENVGDINMTGRKQNLSFMWKKLIDEDRRDGIGSSRDVTVTDSVQFVEKSGRDTWRTMWHIQENR